MTTHKHHIVPKHRGGTDDPSNIIEVTIEQHAELHLAEYLTYGLHEDWIAFHALSGQIGKGEIQKERARMVGLRNAGATRAPLTNEHKEKIRAGLYRGDYHKGSVWEITFTDGRTETIRNLRKFCRENPQYKRGCIDSSMRKGCRYKDMVSVRKKQ